MKATSSEPVIAPVTQDFPGSQAGEPPHDLLAPRGPIRFRFILKFAAQMSTPCSRGVGIKPRAGRMLVRRAPRLFQSHLQRYGVLQ